MNVSYTRKRIYIISIILYIPSCYKYNYTHYILYIIMIYTLLSKETEIIPNVDMTIDTAQQSTYAIARLLMDIVHWFIKTMHLPDTNTVFIILYSLVVLGIAWITGWILQYVLVIILRKLKFKDPNNIYSSLVQRHFFRKICNIIPPIIFLVLIQFTLYTHASIAFWLTRCSWIYIIIVFSISLSTLLDCIWDRLNSRENKRKLPLKGVIQVIKILLWIIAVIVIFAILLKKSPGTLLAGLGAFAAVLMLIFKDSILGVVAGVQLSENDSLHVGDWIAVPGTDANGTVMEVTLTAVKIENWDKTVSTVPPYNLITGGFKNYRNMQESNTRQIQRSYMIDADSVVEVTPEMLQEFSDIPLMKDWIAKKIEQQKEGKVQNVNNSAGLADGTIDTNLGMFRAYVMMYLTQNPNVDKSSTCFVTTLAQTAYGIPLQIYCFTATSSWIPYEGIQASIFEHLAVMMYRFHLYTFESASGRDTILDGYLSPGKNPTDIYGLPYPFFTNSGNPNAPGIPPEGLYINNINTLKS